MKRIYHTDVAIQYKLGILDPNITKQIPSSTLHNWKQKDFSTLVGTDYVNDLEQNLEMIKDFLSKKNLFRAAKAIYFVYSTYRQLFESVKNRGKIVRQSQSTVISTIDRIKNDIGLNRSLRAFGISYQQYHSWKSKVDCKAFPFAQCRKVNPNQLTAKEINTIKKYLNDPKYLHWSLTPVYYQMLRDKASFMSRTSFYKYATLLKLTRPRPLKRKHGKGIRADAPKRILHMDVTIYKPLDHSKVYIYILMDNYSRYILSCKASREYSSRIAFENLHEAYRKYNLAEVNPHIDLITDDGSENKGAVNQFVNTPGVNLNRLIAQKDIIFSNSMVEAVNKRLKYDFLFTTKLQDFEQAQQYLPLAVEEYCNKPHSSLHGLTPLEVFGGSPPDKDMFKKAIRYAASKRKAVNLSQNCPGCSDPTDKS